MYSGRIADKIVKHKTFCTLFISIFLSHPGYAEETTVSFEVKPDRCIALRQGQYCYQNLKFTWTIAEDSNSNEENIADVEFCLIKQDNQQSLVCWLNSGMTKYQYEFESLGDQIFYLQNMQNSQRLAEVRVKVAWVYKNSEKVSTGWRLF